ncbi:cytochrome c oxidase subunit 3 [Alkalilimnicola sp. S0819]|uniref:cytochrome c oxidase subunit 3 n=1 Tax=Alkalilimnicola sp. S0819 TaxID=2613922 RepID=UPI00126140C9|nr:cytochrome c oxidase subunit 3 [Alkalilimnicola sp. S0819]KAB7624436.1 cytochrome c oxidase subunit 3 [Alkalilimnicola sp. S0819]MPQ16269.1 cytochrome c oxidase subunit 3 [Alkalilimnicola sp. S0819]
MAQAQGHYYVPHESHWPIVGSVGLAVSMVGASLYLNGSSVSLWILLTGIAIILFMMAGWFRDVILENESGKFGPAEGRSFRQGMAWFIFSEVMFFGAFFGALFYARVLSVPWLGGDDPSTSRYLWDSVVLAWPTAGPGFGDLEWEPMGAWPLPTINTLLLLTSGVTLTIAHHAIKEGRRAKTILFMWATVLLGLTFMGVQAYEYYEAYAHLNLRMDTGIYGSTFFMLTGFHGFHVLVGAITLLVITLRLMKGHFSAENHFGFEAAAWYWHFVDVVWLGLFLFVYIL